MVKFGGDPIPKSPFTVGVAAPLDLDKVILDNLDGSKQSVCVPDCKVNQQTGYIVSCNRNTVVETGNDAETGGGFSPFCDPNFLSFCFSPHFVF